MVVSGAIKVYLGRKITKNNFQLHINQEIINDDKNGERNLSFKGLKKLFKEFVISVIMYLSNYKVN